MSKDKLAKIVSISSLTIILNAIWSINSGFLYTSRMIVSFVFVAIICVTIYFFDGKLTDAFSKFLGTKVKNIQIIDLFVFFVILTVSIFARWKMLYYETPDYVIFFGRWIDQFREIGWHSLGCSIGDYAPLFSTSLICLSMTKWPVHLVAKFFPMLFDYLLAILCVSLYCEIKEQTSWKNKLIVFSLIILNPLVILNSAAWGQCDSMYTSLIVATLLIILKINRGKAISSEFVFITYGIAFSLKFQAILFLPFLVFFMFAQRKVQLKISQFIWIPTIYFVSAIPMIIAGRSTKEILSIYAVQVGEYTNYLTMGYYNFYSLILGNLNIQGHDAYFALGFSLAFLVLGLSYYVIWKNAPLFSSECICLLGCYTIFVLTFFLPSMHDRYAYCGEIIFVILALSYKKYVLPAFSVFLCSLLTYGEAFSLQFDVLSPMVQFCIALLRLGVIAYIAYILFSLPNKETE